MKRIALAFVIAPALAHAQQAPSDPATSAAPPASAARPRLLLELELYARAQQTRREGNDLSEVRLDRGELGATIALGERADAELRLEAIRSADDGGALGIDGNSTVVRVKTAQVEGARSFGSVEVGGALGFVPDPWIRALEQDYTVKPLSRTASERLLGWPTSDLSAAIRAGIGPARATVTFGNGEGLSYPERNRGKTTTGVVAVTALDNANVRVEVSGVARDGSVGVASIRDRRIGGGVTAVSPWVRGGFEVVAAYGIGDRADLEALVLGGWADGTLYDAGPWRLVAAARGATLQIESTGGGRESTFGGALAVEPWAAQKPANHRDGRGRLRIWLAIDRETTSGNAMTVFGADGGDATLLMLIASAIAPFEVH